MITEKSPKLVLNGDSTDGALAAASVPAAEGYHGVSPGTLYVPFGMCSAMKRFGSAVCAYARSEGKRPRMLSKKGNSSRPPELVTRCRRDSFQLLMGPLRPA